MRDTPLWPFGLLLMLRQRTTVEDKEDVRLRKDSPLFVFHESILGRETEAITLKNKLILVPSHHKVPFLKHCDGSRALVDSQQLGSADKHGFIPRNSDNIVRKQRTFCGRHEALSFPGKQPHLLLPQNLI